MIVRLIVCIWLSIATSVPALGAAQCDSTSRGLIPLTELGGTYKGEPGGLYPDGANTPPPAHDSAGRAIAQSFVALDTLGNIDSLNGAWVLLSIGMSNCNLEFANFAAGIVGDSAIHPRLRLVNGAQGGWAAEDMKYDTSGYWVFPESRLRWVGLHPIQVQAVWLKNVHQGPSGTFPGEAMGLRDDLRDVARLLKVKFPNLRQIFVTSRIYAGYASSGGNPEPYAYESGFANRWLIEAQINGNDSLNFDDTQGPADAPWIAWGPYVYADGINPRSDDSLQWLCEDFNQTDGTHPGTSGIAKVGTMLDEFFRTSPYTSEWFLATTTPSCACDCHPDPVCDDVRSDVLDVVNTINVAFRGIAPAPDPNAACPYETTDVDCTSATDVLDVVHVVNVAFRGVAAATEFCDPCP